MATIHLVYGPQGAGKSTYARRLGAERNLVRFSIDEWMGQLYGPDLPKPMNFAWIMQRVRRCEHRIWATATDIAKTGSDVVLDLGFMKVKSRDEFLERGRSDGHASQLHFVDAPHAVRRARVLTRNVEKGETFAFEVTAPMFDFMEREFEAPTAQELSLSIVTESR